MTNLQPLFDKLLIKPRKYSIYLEALTHPSYRNIKKLNYDYQRLEFLGDAVIQKTVSEFLYKKYPDKDEGFMTKARIMIVQSRTEAISGKKLELNKYILCEQTLFDKQGDLPEKIYEDAFEALIGAIYLDLGEKIVYQVIKRTIIHLYETHYIDKTTLDFKSLFQEAIQRYGKKKIKYLCSMNKLKNGEQIFNVKLYSGGICYGIGIGKNKKDAEREAARNAYNKLVKK